MEKKSRRPKRLLLDKDVIKMLTTASTQLVRGGIITDNTPSIPADNCSGVWGC